MSRKISTHKANFSEGLTTSSLESLSRGCKINAPPRRYDLAHVYTLSQSSRALLCAPSNAFVVCYESYITLHNQKGKFKKRQVKEVCLSPTNPAETHGIFLCCTFNWKHAIIFSSISPTCFPLYPSITAAILAITLRVMRIQMHVRNCKWCLLSLKGLNSTLKAVRSHFSCWCQQLLCNTSSGQTIT